MIPLITTDSRYSLAGRLNVYVRKISFDEVRQTRLLPFIRFGTAEDQSKVGKGLFPFPEMDSVEHQALRPRQHFLKSSIKTDSAGSTPSSFNINDKSPIGVLQASLLQKILQYRMVPGKGKPWSGIHGLRSRHC